MRVWKQKQPNQSEYTNIMTNRPHMLKFIHELLVGLHVSQRRREKKKKTTPQGIGLNRTIVSITGLNHRRPTPPDYSVVPEIFPNQLFLYSHGPP
jgi:hypothetical protein